MINIGDKITLRVSLQTMPKNSEFWTLIGTANLVIVNTKTLPGPIPHIIKSRSASLEVTADAIHTGILKLIPHGMQNNKI